MGYTPHVLVVGGGAVGTGVARDLAMRGLEVTLVERGSLASGATGHMHALLHSGARYAVADTETAGDCYRENRVLRRIAGHCVADAGGLFVSLPRDTDEYFERKVEACETVGIPVERLSTEAARDQEPSLTSRIDRAFAVPDGVVDPYRLCLGTVRSAAQYGATIRTHTTVVDLERDGDAVSAVTVRTDEFGSSTDTSEETFEPDYVVNAAGGSVGKVAGMAGLDVPVRHAKGAMLTVDLPNHGTVVNRCRPKTEGDIAVPFGRASILGTTDRDVDGPDEYRRETGEIDLIVDELSRILPAITDARPLRAYWGVRSLVAQGEEDTTDVTRGYSLLDHEERDGVWGLTSVVGGKLTTHRLIAERVSDQVCSAFGIDRPCQTDEERLPDPRDPSGSSGSDVGLQVHPEPADPGRGESGSAVSPGNPATQVVCDCESVTSADLVRTTTHPGVGMTADLQALRGPTGAAMGACLGGRCVHRLAGSLYPQFDESVVTGSMEALFATCWSEQRHALWGEGLGSAAKADMLHRVTMNRDGQIDGGPNWGDFDDGPETGSQTDADGPGGRDPRA